MGQTVCAARIKENAGLMYIGHAMRISRAGPRASLD
jgi:hypothetical protein